MLPTLVFTLILAASSPSLFAKNPRQEKTKTLNDEEAFKALDKDGDNFLSKEEFEAQPKAQKTKKRAGKEAANPEAGASFEALDADKDGKLTLEEFSQRGGAGPEPGKAKRKGKAQA